MADPVRDARQELIRVGLLGDVRTDGVPDLVMRSWRRSIGNSVDSAAQTRRYADFDSDSVLLRAAAPVLDRWQHQLTDTGATLFLSDRRGSIVARRTSDSSLRRRLDRVYAAEGFDYSEDSIGTNGLGTSMVEKRAVYIEGSQHYSEALAALACAAAPVCAPDGTVMGSISVGGPIESANPLMLSLTREIGQQIEERLRAASRPQDLALAMSFMRFTNSRRPTVVMDRESMLANTPGLTYVSVDSHVLLWELLSEHDWSAGDTARLLLPDARVEVTARRVLDGPRDHFVLHFAEQTDKAASRALPPPVSGATPVLVEGPRGSGRATIARETCPHDRIEEITVVPGAVALWSTVTELLSGGATVLLRRVEDVPEVQAHRFARLLADATRLPGRLLLTASSPDASGAVRSVLEDFAPAERTQPLSRTPERIPGLVQRVFDRLDPGGRHTLSPAALQSLVQWSWPGNIAELADTLAKLLRDFDASVIQREHLPRHLRQAQPRRRLTLLEAAERDAVIKALDAAGGNKSEAAALLGIGRTTLYRRLREFGLDGDESSL